MNGGYIMIKASDADIYLEASRALTIGKPILFYENDTTCYYIDTITLDGTNVVLTKGGKTITIANDNTITTSGDIQNHLYKYYSPYLNITTSDDYYLSFVDFSNEDLQEYIDIINDNGYNLGEKFNALYQFISKLKQIDFVSGSDGSYNGVAYISGDMITLEFEGDSVDIGVDDVEGLLSNIEKVQLF